MSMDNPKRRPERHSAFFDLERDPKRLALSQPRSLLRTTEWGGLTLLSVLVGWAFPPYFLAVMTLAFLNAGGLLWVTHLSEAGRQRLREFEREFAEGHALEEAGRLAEAIAVYERLVPRYQDHPKIAEIATRRIEFLRQGIPAAKARPAKAAGGRKRAAAAPKAGRPRKERP